MSISTNPGSTEAGEHELTCGMRFVARCLEVAAVAGLMWISWCVLGGAGFFVFSMSLLFQIRACTCTRPLAAVSVD